ncbi:MAG: hypothetical protein M1379_02715 [Firmicutes bacterium]|nr:hypothetical protein [Bacillota bacterium]
MVLSRTPGFSRGEVQVEFCSKVQCFPGPSSLIKDLLGVMVLVFFIHEAILAEVYESPLLLAAGNAEPDGNGFLPFPVTHFAVMVSWLALRYDPGIGACFCGFLDLFQSYEMLYVISEIVDVLQFVSLGESKMINALFGTWATASRVNLSQTSGFPDRPAIKFAEMIVEIVLEGPPDDPVKISESLIPLNLDKAPEFLAMLQGHLKLVYLSHRNPPHPFETVIYAYFLP